MKAHWLERQGRIGADELARNDVYYAKLDTDQAKYEGLIEAFKRDRGYIERDIVELTPSTPNLEQICAKFVDEHFHDEDEVRFVLEGEGIFDIRTRDDHWMRIVVEAGDLIVVPKNRHHRFMLTDSKTIRCVRLFQDKAGWTPRYRKN